jgi:hypothetical protein
MGMCIKNNGLKKTKHDHSRNPYVILFGLISQERSLLEPLFLIRPHMCMKILFHRKCIRKPVVGSTGNCYQFEAFSGFAGNGFI